MQKLKNIGKPITFILFIVISVLILDSIDQDWLYFNPYRIIGVQVALSFLLGIFLNAIDKKLAFHFTLFYLVISVLCILLIISFYVFYSYLPYKNKNLSVARSFLAAYSGANFLAAFFKDKNLEDSVKNK